MKRHLIKSAVFSLAIFCMAGCKKVGSAYDVYFYTNIEEPRGPVALHLDDKYIGELPVLKTTLSIKNDTILDKAIHLRLRTGKYKILVTDKQGTVKCSGNLKFRSNRFNGATNPGVVEYAIKDRILVNRIFFE